MSETVKNINALFKTALRSEIDEMLKQLALSVRQRTVFEMFYIEKKDVWYIATELNVSEPVIHRELKKIRIKIAKYMGF